jgi:hypothetical protein
MQARHLLSLALALIAGAGCSPDSQPTEPAVPAAPVDMSGAFQLTIDVATGRVTVTPPRSPAAAMRPGPGALASSVLGSEAIALHAGNCSFSSIAGNSRQKRCTMQVAIENRLELVDLVTPTTFPKPPQGEGLLVFPYTAAALGVPGGGAVPNALWDEAPINFFNDFGGCAGGKTSDCYRWERYSSPLAAGETSAARTVGFDVDKAAQSVSIYILVAADVRDAAPKTVSLTPVEDGCGLAGSNIAGIFATPGPIRVGQGASFTHHGVCTFELPALLEDRTIVSATLTLQQSVVEVEFEAGGHVIAQSVVFPVPMPDNVTDQTTVILSDLGTLTDSPELGPRSIDVLAALVGDIAAGRTLSQYRFNFMPTTLEGAVRFAGVTGGDDDPELIVTYR